jgi:hypothetical protein
VVVPRLVLFLFLDLSAVRASVRPVVLRIPGRLSASG